MSDDQDECEWVFLLVPAYPGSPGPKAVKRLWVCVCVFWCCCLEGHLICKVCLRNPKDQLLGSTALHTHPFNGPFPGLPRWAGTRKVKPIWILLKQETVCGSGISWAICKSAHRSRQITTPAPHHSVFYRPDALPAAQPTASKHWSTALHGVIIVETW